MPFIDIFQICFRYASIQLFFRYAIKIVDIFEYENDYLSIFSREILTKIRNGEKNWLDQLPSGVAEKIMNNDMFGWKSKEVKANNQLKDMLISEQRDPSF